MELRTLLCWASLAAALEGEFPWWYPATPGSQNWASEWMGRPPSTFPAAPQPRTYRTNSVRPGGGRGGGGPAGTGVFFCLGERWSRAPSRDVPVPQLPKLSLLTPDILGILSFSPYSNLQNSSVLPPPPNRKEETFWRKNYRQGRTLC